MLHTQEEILNELFSSPSVALPLPSSISPTQLKLYCEKEIKAMADAGFCPAYIVSIESGTISLVLPESLQPASIPASDFPAELIPALDAIISGKRVLVDSRAAKRRLFFRAAQLHIPLTSVQTPEGKYIIQKKSTNSLGFKILD